MGYDQKTKPSNATPSDYIAELEHPTRKADAEALLSMMTDVTGLKPRLWGDSMIGFGEYHYTYDSGHSGKHFMTGFAARKSNMVLYVMPGYRDLSDRLAHLGKHKLGKACLYINKLADVDVRVLKDLVNDGYQEMIRRYGPSVSD